MSQIRILVADDHPIVREGLVAILDTQEDFEVIGEAASGREAIDQIEQSPPDVLLLDLEMPDGDGLAAGRGSDGERSGMGCEAPPSHAAPRDHG